MIQQSNDLYLAPTYFIDSEHADIQAYAKEKIGNSTNQTEMAIALYYAVRDDFLYDPYEIDLRHEVMKASNIVHRKSAYCIEKACLLAAVARAVGIPARLGFVNVCNHIGTEKLEAFLETNVLVFHGYVELYLAGKWVKATPAFNQSLCEKLGVAPLEFDGKNDSVFQEYDREGGKFMDYLEEYGVFHDVPHDMFIRELIRYYPHLFDTKKGADTSNPKPLRACLKIL